LSADAYLNQPALDRARLVWGVFILALIIIAPGIYALLVGKYLVGFAALLAPLPFLFIAHRRLAFYLFLFSLCFQYTLPMNRFNFHPYDLAMAILFLSVITDFLLHGRTTIRSTIFEWSWGWLIGATFVSGLLAHNPSYSIVPMIRIMAIYLCYRAVYYSAEQIGVRRILIWFVRGMIILSAINILLAIRYGGAVRVFGPMGTPFNGFAITALPIALAFYIWARNRREQFWFGLAVPVILMGIVATQSRAPLMSVLISVPIVLWLARGKLKSMGMLAGNRRIRRMFFWIGLAGASVVLVSGAFFLPLLERLSGAIDSLTSPRGTIALRVILWKAALKAFLSSPLTGIGIGNFHLIDQVVPEIRLEPVYYYIRGLSAHSLALHYLAETGILGLAALLNLAVQGIRRTGQIFKMTSDESDMQVSAGLLVGSIAFAHSLFYIGFWTWTQGGYFLAILFALNTTWYQQQKARLNG
jgi:O-antigen ligase